MTANKEIHQYDDIINLPHHQSLTRPHMSIYDRAAQFSPFSALTGHEEAIEETARLTEQEIEIDEDRKARLNEKLQMVEENLGTETPVTITYFEPDGRKEGGRYLTVSGVVKKLDHYEHKIVFVDGMEIDIDRMIAMEIFGEEQVR